MGTRYRVVIGPDVRVTRDTVRDDLAAIAKARDITVDLLDVSDIEEVRAALVGSPDGAVLDPGSLDLGPALLADLPGPVVLASPGVAPAWAAAIGPPAAAWAQPIVGRGIGTYGWALRRLHHGTTNAPVARSYGEHPDQVGDVWLPTEGQGPFPVVVLIHGGLWQQQWQRDLMDDLAADLTTRGMAAWNLEHRRVDPGQSGIPHVIEDGVHGVAHIATLARQFPLDATRVAVVGHSAGGQLALCAAIADRLGLPAVDPPLRGIVTLAGYPDLAEAATRRLGNHAVPEFVGGDPHEVPDRYRLASPRCHLPIGVPHVAVQGLDDGADLIDINRLFVAEAKAAGDDARLDEVASTDHFAVIDPSTTAWRHTVTHLERLLAEVVTSGS